MRDNGNLKSPETDSREFVSTTGPPFYRGLFYGAGQSFLVRLVYKWVQL